VRLGVALLKDLDGKIVIDAGAGQHGHQLASAASCCG
jgi:hypothetical protein